MVINWFKTLFEKSTDEIEANGGSGTDEISIEKLINSLLELSLTLIVNDVEPYKSSMSEILKKF